MGWDSQEQFTFLLELSPATAAAIAAINAKQPLLQPGKTWLINGGPQGGAANPYAAYTRPRGSSSSSLRGTIGGYVWMEGYFSMV